MNDNRVVGEFGRGAYGDTIILQPRSRHALAWLRSVFISLAGGDLSIRLDSSPEVDLHGISRLELRLVEYAHSRALVRLSADDEFVWRGTREQWQELAAALDPLLAGRTGHQYLTREVEDDALVEVTFGEPDVRVPADE